ncbi:MAG: hypothetical protein HZB23_02585 [Deltaproteobacteria bacterium]|nr:hypothetical protein [Deltaproteobacteria bacterium]
MLYHCLFFGPVFFLVQEYMQSNGMLLPHVYSFSNQAAVTLLGVPLAAVVGHIFTFALGFALGARILRNLHLPRNVSLMMIISIPMTMGVAYLIEICGTTAGWWTWGSGGVPWWQDPELKWMGEESAISYLGIVTLGPGSLGNVPHVLLGGWSMWPISFSMAYMLLMSWRKNFSGFLPYLGYVFAFLMLLICGMNASLGFIIFIPILAEGARTYGNRTILAENLSLPRRKELTGYLEAYGDFIAYFILMGVVLYVEISAGFSVNFIPSWIPLGYLTLLAFVRSRRIVILLLAALVPPVFASNFIDFSPLWIAPFKILYYGAAITALALIIPEGMRRLYLLTKNKI